MPNEELRQELILAVEDRKWSEFMAFLNASEQILEATLDGDADTVAKGIGHIHDTYAPAISYDREDFLSGVLTLGYLASMQYYFKPIREMPAGHGFAGFVYLPKPEYRSTCPAMIVELKWNQNAQTALNQILLKNYPDSVKEYTDNILLAGISYDKTTREHQCQIIRNQASLIQ